MITPREQDIQQKKLKRNNRFDKNDRNNDRNNNKQKYKNKDWKKSEMIKQQRDDKYTQDKLKMN